MKRCHGRLHYDRKFQIFIFLIGYFNVNKGVFCLIISYLRIKSYNVLNYNNCSTDWSFPLIEMTTRFDCWPFILVYCLFQFIFVWLINFFYIIFQSLQIVHSQFVYYITASCVGRYDWKKKGNSDKVPKVIIDDINDIIFFFIYINS